MLFRSINITKAHTTEIKEYLQALDLIINCPIETGEPGTEPVEHILFTQPGMRYCQAKALVHSLMKDPRFSELSEREKAVVSARIRGEVRGRMMEDIVLLETMKAAGQQQYVFQLQFMDGEFDMVIYDADRNCCRIYEIKHSEQQVPAQYRHLLDAEKCRQAERRFGPIVGRTVLYRGADADAGNGIVFKNVETYLNRLSPDR